MQGAMFTASALTIAASALEANKVSPEDWLLEGTSRAGLVGPTSDGKGVTLNQDGSPAVFTPQAGGNLDYNCQSTGLRTD